MLDALKDLYISYPFMPVEEPPALFAHVKDIRCVVELPAKNSISLVENDNNIRAWLVSLTSRKALIKVRCNPYSFLQVLEVPVYVASVGAPATNSYVLVDDAIVYPQDALEYELQPDTLLFMQKAPIIKIDTNGYANTLAGNTINTAYSQNVSITAGNGGIIIYGAPGAGFGVYTSVPGCYSVPQHLEGKGAISINGLYGYVRLDAAHPVEVVQAVDLPHITLNIENAEV